MRSIGKIFLARLAALVIGVLCILACGPGAFAQSVDGPDFALAPVPTIDGCPQCKVFADRLLALPAELAQLKTMMARLDQDEAAYRAAVANRGATPGEHARAGEYGKMRSELNGRMLALQRLHKTLLKDLDACLRACRAPPPPAPVSQVFSGAPTTAPPPASQQMYDIWAGLTDGGAWMGLIAVLAPMLPDEFGEVPEHVTYRERVRAEQITTTSLCVECDPLVGPVKAALAARDRALARLQELPGKIADTREAMNVLRAKLGEVRDDVATLQQQLPGANAEAGTALRAEIRRVASRGDGPGRELDALLKAYSALRAEKDSLQVQLPRLEDALEAAKDALALCNGRCSTDVVSLERVIGYVGFNPFDPRGLSPPENAGTAGVLQFSASAYSGGEGGVVAIFVARVFGSRGAVSVSYATQTGSADAADFAAASGTLSWADGDTTSKLFTVALVDDTIVEGAESFRVTLSAPTGGAVLGDIADATVTIVDNDSPPVPAPSATLQFSASAYTVAENAGSAMIMVTRTGGGSGDVSVQFFTGPGSATAGSDYQAVAGVVTWRAGDMTPKTFMVPIVNDTSVEGPETFFVTLNSPSAGATLGAPATATVTINDDDVSSGPCGATGNAWQPNAGQYTCSGNCAPNPSPRLSINGDLLTATNFHGAPTPATFQGCSQSLTSREGNLTYFGQANHRATITRTSDANFSANILSSGGGSCFFTCSRTGP